MRLSLLRRSVMMSITVNVRRGQRGRMHQSGSWINALPYEGIKPLMDDVGKAFVDEPLTIVSEEKDGLILVVLQAKETIWRRGKVVKKYQEFHSWAGRIVDAHIHGRGEEE